MKSKGLGDTIEKFTTATGIKSFTQYLNKKVYLVKKVADVIKEKMRLTKHFLIKKINNDKYRYSISKSISLAKQRTKRLYNTSRI